MAGLECRAIDLCTETKPAALTDHIGIMLFKGQVEGALSLHFKTETARNIISSFCGLKESELDDDVSDGINEVVNLTAGASKIHFDNTPLHFEMNIPLTVEAAKYVSPHPDHLKLETIQFELDGQIFFMQLSLQENESESTSEKESCPVRSSNTSYKFFLHLLLKTQECLVQTGQENNIDDFSKTIRVMMPYDLKEGRYANLGGLISKINNDFLPLLSPKYKSNPHQFRHIHHGIQDILETIEFVISKLSHNGALEKETVKETIDILKLRMDKMKQIKGEFKKMESGS